MHVIMVNEFFSFNGFSLIYVGCKLRIAQKIAID